MTCWRWVGASVAATEAPSAPNMKSEAAFNIAGDVGSWPKISDNDWLSSSLAHIGEPPDPGTTPRERREAIMFKLKNVTTNMKNKR